MTICSLNDHRVAATVAKAAVRTADDETARASTKRPLKVIVGVDPMHPPEVVSELLMALAPGDVQIRLVHIFNPAAQKEPQAALRRIRIGLEACGLGATCVTEASDTVEGLIRAARNEGADLIAIGSQRGSNSDIAKGLLTRSPISLLIAKTRPSRTDGLVAVLATDHSDFMVGCLYRLRDIAPRGLREIIVLTANDQPYEPSSLIESNGNTRAEACVAQLDALQRENQKLCEWLAPICKYCWPVCLDGEANSAIRKAMKGNFADLLIIGAPKHDFLGRILGGSVLYEQAIASPYSVLALRPEPVDSWTTSGGSL